MPLGPLVPDPFFLSLQRVGKRLHGGMQRQHFNAITQRVTVRAGVNQPLPAGPDVFAGTVKAALDLGRGAAFYLNGPVLPVWPGEQQSISAPALLR